MSISESFKSYSLSATHSLSGNQNSPHPSLNVILYQISSPPLLHWSDDPPGGKINHKHFYYTHSKHTLRIVMKESIYQFHLIPSMHNLILKYFLKMIIE